MPRPPAPKSGRRAERRATGAPAASLGRSPGPTQPRRKSNRSLAQQLARGGPRTPSTACWRRIDDLCLPKSNSLFVALQGCGACFITKGGIARMGMEGTRRVAGSGECEAGACGRAASRRRGGRAGLKSRASAESRGPPAQAAAVNLNVARSAQVACAAMFLGQKARAPAVPAQGTSWITCGVRATHRKRYSRHESAQSKPCGVVMWPACLAPGLQGEEPGEGAGCFSLKLSVAGRT